MPAVKQASKTPCSTALEKIWELFLYNQFLTIEFPQMKLKNIAHLFSFSSLKRFQQRAMLPQNLFQARSTVGAAGQYPHSAISAFPFAAIK